MKKECNSCRRLCAFIAENKRLYPDFYNAPVPSFGDINAKLLIVGLAPGLKGANRTGRPFTADYAGDLLYPTLLKFHLAQGEYKARSDDGLQLVNTRITNAVLCVPPANKVTAEEIKTCNVNLQSEIANMPNLTVILALGAVAHKAVLLALGQKQSTYKFAHNAKHKLVCKKDITLIDSYHCSRYNTSTGVLTTEMFEAVIAKASNIVKGKPMPL